MNAVYKYIKDVSPKDIKLGITNKQHVVFVLHISRYMINTSCLKNNDLEKPYRCSHFLRLFNRKHDVVLIDML